MRRSQFIAALVLVVALGGLIVGRFGTDDGATAGGDPAADGGAQPAGSEAITGGERASTADPGGAGSAGTSSGAGSGPDGSASDRSGADGSAGTLAVAEAPPVLDPKPELTGLDGWLQSDATGLASFDGQVRIVQFWTFGCHNCKATLPHLQELYARHHDDGLEIIGVHAPEFAHEAEVDNIAAAAVDLGVTWPIALDTDKVNFRAWQGARRFWPRTYVLDREGNVRFDHIGEGRYDELADTVEYLLAEGA